MSNPHLPVSSTAFDTALFGARIQFENGLETIGSRLERCVNIGSTMRPDKNMLCCG